MYLVNEAFESRLLTGCSKRGVAMAKAFKPVILTLAVAMSITGQAQANSQEEDIWADEDWGVKQEQVSPWQIFGFIEAGFGVFNQDNVVSKSQSLSETTAQVEGKYTSDSFQLSSKFDVTEDRVLSKTDFDIRELNLSFTFGQHTDVIAGRQVVTWGTGDYLFLNDLFAKDWQSFFAGRDDAYLKAPNDVLRVMHYRDDVTIDFVYSPKFTPDNYINGERFSFYSPIVDEVIAPEHFNVTTTNNDQFSVRVATTIDGTEYALYGYKGYWTTPVGMIAEGINSGHAYFPKLNSYGVSLRTTAYGGIFNAEISIYNSVEDARGSDPFIANDQTRFLLGYERELKANLTASFQYYLERTGDFEQFKSAMPESITKENRQVLTARLTHRALRQTLTTNLFVFYSPTDKDAYIKPSISYRYSDNWQMSAGANIFLGENQQSFFGQHEDNSNLWLRMRYNF